MQPPYFFSRQSLEKMIAVGPQIKADPTTPFIDWYYVQLVYAAGLRHTGFPCGMSCETSSQHGRDVMSEHVSRGATFCHSIKNAAVREHLQHLYKLRNP